jgi:hypothetical protein
MFQSDDFRREYSFALILTEKKQPILFVHFILFPSSFFIVLRDKLYDYGHFLSHLTHNLSKWNCKLSVIKE